MIAIALLQLACASCALQQEAGGGKGVLLALMIAVPYAVSFLVVRAIRNADRQG